MNETAATKLLTDKLTAWLVPIFTAGLAAWIAKSAAVLPWLDLSPLDAIALGSGIAAAIVAIVVGTLNNLANKLLKAGTAQLQAKLNTVLKLEDVPAQPITVDGIAGENTNKAVDAVVSTLLSTLTKKS